MIATVALGAVVFANLVSLIPGHVGARTRTSPLLRAESPRPASGQAAAPQGRWHVCRNSLVDLISAMGELAVDPGKTTTTSHLRHLKVFGAFAVSLLVGLGAYTGTYRALDLLSEPPAAAPITSQSPAPPPAPTPHLPVH
jgi:hypothetical protein